MNKSHSRIRFSEQLDVSIMATHESLFLNQEDHFAYEVAQAIDTGVKLTETLYAPATAEHYVLSAAAVARTICRPS